MAATRLTRSRDERLIAGVCGGIAEFLGWSPDTVRLGYIILSVLSAAFPGIMVYMVLWLVMPQAPRRPRWRDEGGRTA